MIKSLDHYITFKDGMHTWRSVDGAYLAWDGKELTKTLKNGNKYFPTKHDYKERDELINHLTKTDK